MVRLFSRPGDTIVDPFAGIGTIPLEAALQGRASIGNDLSPVAYITTAAKLEPIDSDKTQDLLDELDSAVTRGSGDQVEPEIADFYHERTLAEICAARQFLANARLESRPGAMLLSAAMMHLLHGNRPYALSRRSHNIIPIPPKGPREYKPVVPHLRAKLARHVQPLSPMFVPGHTHRVAAEDLADLIAPADCVITSPPFLGTTEFLRQNRVRLWFAGWDYETQGSMKQSFYEHIRDKPQVLANIGTLVAALLRPGGIAVLHLGVVRNFDMAAVLVENPPADLEPIDVVYEDATHLESHGRSDRGGTRVHSYLIMRKRSVPSVLDSQRFKQLSTKLR